MDRLLLVVTVLAVAALLAWWWRRRDGRVVVSNAQLSREQLAALGVTPGRPALVEFTAPHCAPCVTARQVLDEVADTNDAVVVTVDAGDDVALAHRVLRVPTTFVVSANGALKGRISGIPTSSDVRELLVHQAGRAVD